MADPMHVALATCSRLPDLDPDEHVFRDVLRGRGHEVGAVCWDDPGVHWAGFDAVLPRSTWDYHHRRDEFLAWTRRVETATRILNPAALLRWNSHKGYLLELAARGAPVVPTVLLPRGARAVLREILAERGWSRAVVKPAVGADGFGTTLVEGDVDGQARLDALVPERDVLVQPYLDAVVEPGERCLIHLGGRLSHAVRKRSLFLGGRHAGPEGLAVAPEPDEVEAAAHILRVAGAGDALYARVDLLRDEAGRPRLVELELVEPTLFFAAAPGAAERLAAALEERLGR